MFPRLLPASSPASSSLFCIGFGFGRHLYPPPTRPQGRHEEARLQTELAALQERTHADLDKIRVETAGEGAGAGLVVLRCLRIPGGLEPGGWLAGSSWFGAHATQ